MHEASPHGIVTLSAGLAVAGADRTIATTASLIEAADAALYAAKARGRNTFTVDRGAEAAPPPPPTARRNAA